MSEVSVTQLYLDVEKLAENRQGKFAGPALLEIFNKNLADAKKNGLGHDILAAVPEASGQVTLGDLLVRVGQLMVSMGEPSATPQRMVNQLYSDIDKLAKNRPGDFAKPATLGLFNANLAFSKKIHPGTAELISIPVATGQARLADLLTRVGQLMAALAD